jgi:hypothetical protein
MREELNQKMLIEWRGVGQRRNPEPVSALPLVWPRHRNCGAPNCKPVSPPSAAESVSQSVIDSSAKDTHWAVMERLCGLGEGGNASGNWPTGQPKMWQSLGLKCLDGGGGAKKSMEKGKFRALEPFYSADSREQSENSNILLKVCFPETK